MDLLFHGKTLSFLFIKINLDIAVWPSMVFKPKVIDKQEQYVTLSYNVFLSNYLFLIFWHIYQMGNEIYIE